LFVNLLTGLKAELVKQLQDALEEQSEELNDNNVGHDSQQLIHSQEYQTSTDSESYVNPLSNASSILSNALQTRETPDIRSDLRPDNYYSQSVPQYTQQVYDSTPNYIQTPYEAQYQYPTHPVFSPPPEQFSQSAAPYQMTPQMTPQLPQQLAPQLPQQMSPQLSPQMSPQMSPRITPQMTPQLTPQMTSQLSPQMTAQQYRSPEFHSPHRGFQPNESPIATYQSEYDGQPGPEQIYGMSHMNLQTLSQTQTPIPSVPPQMVHRSPVIERHIDMSQTQTLPQNIRPDMNTYNPEVNRSEPIKNEPFIPCVQPQQQHLAPPDATEDILNFDDVSLGVDPTNEVQYNQYEQNQAEFEMPVASHQYQHHIPTHNQTFEDTPNQLQDLAADDTDTDETNQSDSNGDIREDQVKPIESNFSEPQIITSETSAETSEPQLETVTQSKSNQISESSTDSSDTNETDADSQKADGEYGDSNAIVETVTNDEVTAGQDLETKQQGSAVNQVNFEVQEDSNTIDEESKSSETPEEQENENSVEEAQTSNVSVEPIVTSINGSIRSTQDENKPPSKAVTRIESKANDISMSQTVPKSEAKDNKKLTKNQKRKQRKKNRANRRKLEQDIQKQTNQDDDKMDIEDENDDEEVEIE